MPSEAALVIGLGLLTMPGSLCNHHKETKHIAKATQQEIIVHDANRFHHLTLLVSKVSTQNCVSERFENGRKNIFLKTKKKKTFSSPRPSQQQQRFFVGSGVALLDLKMIYICGCT